jgi:hypothetical protein
LVILLVSLPFSNRRYAGLSSIKEIKSATDALSWHEFFNTNLVGGVPGLSSQLRPSARTGNVPAELVPDHLIITSPNMLVIPDISKDNGTVRVREDGRFYYHDFTLTPQWYFDDTFHLPYVLKKPSAAKLPTHKYRVIWHDLKESDWVKEDGAAVRDRGRIRQDLVDECAVVRKELHKDVVKLAKSGTIDRIQLRQLMTSNEHMQYTLMSLETGCQDWLSTLLTFTLFQRFFLETLAVYDHFTKWLDRTMAGEEYHPVDETIMGAVTCDVVAAQKMFARGVPVWLVRSPSEISPRHVFYLKTWPSDLTDGMCKTKYPGALIVFECVATPLRNRVIQRLQISNIPLSSAAAGIRLGHAGDSKYILFVTYSWLLIEIVAPASASSNAAQISVAPLSRSAVPAVPGPSSSSAAPGPSSSSAAPGSVSGKS